MKKKNCPQDKRENIFAQLCASWWREGIMDEIWRQQGKNGMKKIKKRERREVMSRVVTFYNIRRNKYTDIMHTYYTNICKRANTRAHIHKYTPINCNFFFIYIGWNFLGIEYNYIYEWNIYIYIYIYVCMYIYNIQS